MDWSHITTSERGLPDESIGHRRKNAASVTPVTRLAATVMDPSKATTTESGRGTGTDWAQKSNLESEGRQRAATLAKSGCASAAVHIVIR